MDRGRFERCCRALGADDVPASVFEALADAYAEPHRAYHTAAHVAECLAELDRHPAEHPAEVEAALWFHDAVYDPRATDNEARSATWARAVLLDGGAPTEVAERVYRLVLATAHDAQPEDADARLLVDIDLSILGADPERFDRYDAQIREEYGWVPEEAYRAGRARVLESFLARPTIYATEAYRRSHEARARRNLARALQRLR